ncbi:MAG: SEC-C domain-containing protein [Actinomycetota bacterium]
MSEGLENSRVGALLQLGCSFTGGEWPHYPTKYHLAQEDIPDLVRIATAPELSGSDPDGLLVWAPVHARRALAQLGAVEAIESLLSLVPLAGEDEDVILDELPRVLAMLGPAGLPQMAAYLQDRSKPMDDRWLIGGAISELAARHPETRAECVGLLTGVIASPDDDDPELNGALIGELAKLGAVEALPLIREAFGRGAVSAETAGDLEDIEIELGVRKRLDPVAAASPGSVLERRAPPGREPDRNAPCPCGSGLKYKKCCLKLR